VTRTLGLIFDAIQADATQLNENFNDLDDRLAILARGASIVGQSSTAVPGDAGG